jgi:thiamine biosynthesis lipoprotein
LIPLPWMSPRSSRLLSTRPRSNRPPPRPRLTRHLRLLTPLRHLRLLTPLRHLRLLTPLRLLRMDPVVDRVGSPTRTIPLMGGTAVITAVDGTDEMLDHAIALADRCESVWSRFLPLSDICRLNNAGGATVEVDPLTLTLIESMRVGVSETGGDFDPTLLPAVLEAGYTSSMIAPDLTTELSPWAQAAGDLSDIAIDGVSVRMPRGLTLDAGGIGKGLAADLVCAQLIGDGATGAMAQISGDLVVAGRAPDSHAWRLGVEDPFVEGSHRAIIRLGSGALVTSSRLKRRFTTSRGERHHLIDPRTLDSAVTEVQTVSVIAGSGARAETLTKPGFLRDPSDFLDWLPGVGAAGLVIDRDGRALTSTNWRDYE